MKKNMNRCFSWGAGDYVCLYGGWFYINDDEIRAMQNHDNQKFDIMYINRPTSIFVLLWEKTVMSNFNDYFDVYWHTEKSFCCYIGELERTHSFSSKS